MTDPKYTRLETFQYHVVSATVAIEMTRIREQFYRLAQMLVDLNGDGRCISLALTSLEESAMRAIQSLALKGEPIDIGTVYSGALEDK